MEGLKKEIKKSSRHAQSQTSSAQDSVYVSVPRIKCTRCVYKYSQEQRFDQMINTGFIIQTTKQTLLHITQEFPMTPTASTTLWKRVKCHTALQSHARAPYASEHKVPTCGPLSFADLKS